MYYSGLTIANKNLIKRFSHSQRYLYASRLISKYKPNKVLDYGAGKGRLAKKLAHMSLNITNYDLYTINYFYNFNCNWDSSKFCANYSRANHWLVWIICSFSNS